MKLSPQLVVHEHDPLKKGILIGVLLIVLIGLAYLSYDYGHSRADYDYDALEQSNEMLEKQISQLTDDLEKTRDELVAIKSSSEVEQLAYKEVDATLRNLQSEILELKEEVAFYRSIVAPRESARGLRIQRFSVEPVGKGYRYKLVLTQVIKNSRITRGKILMDVEGIQNGKTVRLNLTSLSTRGQKQLDFRFKYFQSFEGILVVPAGFAPSRVHIKVAANRVTLEKTFSWPDASLKTSAL